MQTQFSASSPAGSPDAFGAAASYVQREYGYTGYLMAVADATSTLTVFEVSHFDGSRFNVVADKWGNVQTIPEEASIAKARELIGNMARNACSV